MARLLSINLVHSICLENQPMKTLGPRFVLALVGLATCLAAARLAAADLEIGKDPDTGWGLMTVKQGDMAVRIVPQAGCNVESIRFKGTELLKTPKSLKDLPGFMYGVPVLYPMPNRVRDGAFTFDGRKFTFPPNNNGNFLHGLVHSVAWQGGDINLGNVGSLTYLCPFEPGNEPFKSFPFPHLLKLEIQVANHSVRWIYTVDNSKGDKPVPYGFALHPWFLYQGSRRDTFVTIPATHLMAAEKLLPTGKLLDLAGQADFDARQPRSLEGFVRDDVYYGMTPEQPALIDFRAARLKITLSTSAEFTHLVLYTPKDEGWFCVENQTCSTDAHNLFARGLKKESHLQVVEPGQTGSGWVEYKFESY